MPSVRQRIEAIEATLRARDRYSSIAWQRRRRQLLFAMSQSVGGTPSLLPTSRWETLRPHTEQSRLWRAESRIRLVPAGRRSGKTELAKRFGVLSGSSYPMETNGWIHFLAPTRTQAKVIFWDDIKKLVPAEFVVGEPLETELTVSLFNGVTLNVAGMDEPARIEGHKILGCVLDEFGNMKKEAWTHHLRPALADTLGWAWLIGVPEGRNHYYEEVEMARSQDSATKEVFTWSSRTVLPPEEIEALLRDMDEATAAQELDATFLNFFGRVYYPFDRDYNVLKQVPYDVKADLQFCFDFNVSPGVAAVMQDREGSTYVLDEVYIPNDSNTPLVCKELLNRWSDHEGRVVLYGDASGGARGTAKVNGSDWELIDQSLKSVFKQRLVSYVPRQNPPVKARINSLNSRMKNALDERRFFVNAKCTHVIKDFEGVLYKKGTSEIDKDTNRNLTHISDAIGYAIQERHPFRSTRLSSTSQSL